MTNENEKFLHDSDHAVADTQSMPPWGKLCLAIRRSTARFLQRQKNRTDRIERVLQENTIGFERCVGILRGCQEQVAKVLDHEVERHALNPAVETVALLADEIDRLEKLATQFAQQHQPCPNVQRIIDEIAISRQIAADRLRYLDVTRIVPSNGDVFDSKLHVISAVASTEDVQLNGVIHQTLTPGVLYRGTVLRTARVKVFKVER